MRSDPKAVYQIELIGQLKTVYGINANETQNVFVLLSLEKIKETRLKFFQGSVTEFKRWKIIKKRESN